MHPVLRSVISSTCTNRKAGARRTRRAKPIQRAGHKDMWPWSPLSHRCTSSPTTFLLSVKVTYSTVLLFFRTCARLVLFMWLLLCTVKLWQQNTHKNKLALRKQRTTVCLQGSINSECLHYLRDSFSLGFWWQWLCCVDPKLLHL